MFFSILFPDVQVRNSAGRSECGGSLVYMFFFYSARGLVTRVFLFGADGPVKNKLLHVINS